MSQRVLSSEPVPQTEEEDFGGDVEDIFTRESREIGVEFVRLLLGDVPPASKGPGDGQQGTAARSADERSSDCRSPSARPAARALAGRLRAIGDEIDSFALEQAVLDIVTAHLRHVSVYSVTDQVFRELGNRVLRGLASQLTNGWKQISAIYHILSLLVRELRIQTPPAPRNTIQRDREALFNTFTAQYMREVGLEAWVQQQGGYSAILDPGLNDIGTGLTPVTIRDSEV